MSDRIPIRFDRAVRPEWLDYALEQSVRRPDEASQREALREYLSSQIAGKEALDKTVTQLQRVVGTRSSISKEQRCATYERMSQLAPDERGALRLMLLVQASPFFSDCVGEIRKMALLSPSGFTSAQVIERLTSKYGDRAVVPRAARRILQTLIFLGAITRDKNWQLTSLLDSSC